MRHILIVEDERELSEGLARYLRQVRYEVTACADGVSALEVFARRAFDLVVLDVRLPHLDGWGVCRVIRASSAVPVMMLSALGSEADRVRGFEVGADDYVVKPFSLREVELRVAALLRRRGPERASPTLPGLTLDEDTLSVTVDGETVACTRREFEVLRVFVTHPERIFSREWLLERLWGLDYDGSDRTVDTHVARLRQRFGGTRYAHSFVAVRHLGYRFVPPREGA